MVFLVSNLYFVRGISKSIAESAGRVKGDFIFFKNFFVRFILTVPAGAQPPLYTISEHIPPASVKPVDFLPATDYASAYNVGFTQFSKPHYAVRIKDMRQILAMINSAVGVIVLAILCTPFFLQQHTAVKLDVESESVGVIGGNTAPTTIWLSSPNEYATWLCALSLCTLFVVNAFILFNSVKKNEPM